MKCVAMCKKDVVLFKKEAAGERLFWENAASVIRGQP